MWNIYEKHEKSATNGSCGLILYAIKIYLVWYDPEFPAYLTGSAENDCLASD